MFLLSVSFCKFNLHFFSATSWKRAIVRSRSRDLFKSQCNTSSTRNIHQTSWKRILVSKTKHIRKASWFSNWNSYLNFWRIPGEFQKNSWRIPEEFRKRSWRIPKPSDFSFNLPTCLIREFRQHFFKNSDRKSSWLLS